MANDRIPLAPPARRVRWRPWVRHLRLHFNVLLSPVYLYGLLLGAGAAGEAAPLARPATLAAWLSLHLFLYGGTTAFNSYYDRDEGPVGGMLHPPRVDGGLLPFSLAVQVLGLPLAIAVGAPFTVAWLGLGALFAAYSHPTVRLKARPAAALATVALGQGAGGFALGWLVLAPPTGLRSADALAGMAATALVVGGLYVVTQSYQTAEDRARGDRTLPVLLGPGRALGLAVAALAPGGAVLAAHVHRLGGAAAALPLALGLVALGGWTLRWARRFDERDVTGNHRRAMTVARVAGLGLSAVLVAFLTGVGVANAFRAGLPVL